ncbi:MAG: hypothetical protein J6S54_08530 [Lentisphaeria bacterium]|nr:hypothetical protein [Lentisphaeria bacterium]
MVRTGFASQIITPPREFPLAGYFNKRPNRGVYDDLFVKVLLVEKEGVTGGFVVYDLCGSSPDFFNALRSAAKKAGLDFADNLMISCTHTHTGSEIRRDIDAQKQTYIDEIIAKTVTALKEAAANMRESSFEAASVNSNPYAYVRRFWMKSGKVITNPGKCNPDIVKPDGDYDRTISAVAVKQEGRIAAILVNLANHGDTIGGDFVSADWFGRMEREIQYQLCEDVPVMTLTDCSGDINHFDVTTLRNQTNYNEALRIGRGYGQIICELLKKLEKVDDSELSFKKTIFKMAYRTVTAQQLADARKVLETIPEASLDNRGDMTSEDLAKGDATVLRMFAQRLLGCEGNEGKFQECELLALTLSKDLAFITLPGEPFNGVAQGIRAASPYKRTLIATLAQGKCGYIPMPESFERGGYETEPFATSPEVDTAPKLIAAALETLNK